VDAVSDIIAITDEDLQPPPDLAPNTQNGVIKSLTLLDERMIRVLDLPNVVLTEQCDAA
ncbi:MAG: chemotaxis protein CheW, partial [Paracoccaceae bacterium]